MSQTRSSADHPGEVVIPIESYDAIVCDLDGVVYRGDGEVPGAPNALQDMAARGVRVLYATNNASRVPSEVAEHLRRLGAPAGDDDVVTSAEAGAAIVGRHVAAGSAVLALGGEGLSWALDRAGFRAVPPAHAPGQPVAAILQGLGRQLTVADFEVAARLIAEGAVWVVTNGDTTLPLQWGTAPGNGAYVDLLRTATRQEPVAVAGKPQPPLYELAVDRLATDPGRTLAIGDRLDTDIAGALAAGLHSAWVLTGVDLPSALLATDLDPTFVVASLADLLQPYAVPLRHADTWRCAGATARFEGDDLRVDTGDAEPIEAVRAGLAALLERRDGSTRDPSTREGETPPSADHGRPASPTASTTPSPTAALAAAAAVLDDLVAEARGG